METRTGYVENIIYQNRDNGYTVLKMITEKEELICTGSFYDISEGEYCSVQGEFNDHPVYGIQFHMQSYEIAPPQDRAAIERYLGSGSIKGIGAALARRIVNCFGDDTFRIMEEEPERLSEIKGISDRKAREISEQINEKKGQRRAMLYLQKFGLSLSMSNKVHKKYGDTIYQMMEENPYRLAEDIQGIGFKIADEIARKAGILKDSDYRIKSAVLYVLSQAAAEGHTFLPAEELISRAREILSMPEAEVEAFFLDLMMEKKLMLKEEQGQKRVYASSYYYLELNVSRMLHELNLTEQIEEVRIQNKLDQLQDNLEIELDGMQHEAVLKAAASGLFILTGGPGTGKTTTINMMIRYFESEGYDFYLAAPTGRAAKRMTETTGYEAQTIHRLLEVCGIPEESTLPGRFEKNEENPLEADVVIIDEMSMVDIHLMHSLLRAIVPGTRLILVGDVNQLPSVGPGCVLRDMIEAGIFSVVKLTKIFRQASKSDIVVNAHKINRGEPVPLNNKSMDFFFLKRQDANVIISVVIQLIRDKLPPYVKASPFDIQVLTPMRKGLLGVERLNRILQEYLNPPEKEKVEKEYKEGLFRVGDKVMQIKNNYQMEWEIRSRYGIALEKGIGIFNGDMGKITEINTFSEKLTVEFEEGRSVEYSFKQLEELELAYAITIHKAQGSEYPAVVIPLLSGPRMLLNRNLLYTAVTRAKKCVTVVGSEETFQKMIGNRSEQKRYSGLKDRIEEQELL